MKRPPTLIPAKPTIRVIACGMIAREVLGVNQQLGYDHVDLKCLPADFHHHPEKIAPAMDEAITQARADGFDNVFVGYADCGTGGELDKICKKHNVERIEGPHCFSFYMGNQNFDESDDDFLTTFFITDFLARHFDSFMKRPLGLDRHPELKEMYFSNYTRALYLAQTEDRELQDNAKEVAEFLGLEYEYRFTGYGDLVSALKINTSKAQNQN
ncbi:MAG: DUF1638 domain-containing protein [Pseudomonadota bacterium]